MAGFLVFYAIVGTVFAALCWRRSLTVNHDIPWPAFVVCAIVWPYTMYLAIRMFMAGDFD